MEQKKFNKIIMILVIISIIVSVLGTVLLVNSIYFAEPQTLEDGGTTSAGSISLNIANDEPEEYSSSGMISLDIVDNDQKNNMEE